MKLYKIGQPWQNELLVDNKTRFIDNKTLVLPVLKEKLAAQNPGVGRLSNFV